MDTFEGDNDSEYPSLLLGTYGSDGSPLHQRIVEITTNSDEDDVIEFDHAVENTADTVQYDLGAGQVTTQLDVGAVVNATVTFTDGTTYTSTFAPPQDQNGELFLLISDDDTALASAHRSAVLRLRAACTFCSDATTGRAACCVELGPCAFGRRARDLGSDRTGRGTARCAAVTGDVVVPAPWVKRR